MVPQRRLAAMLLEPTRERIHQMTSGIIKNVVILKEGMIMVTAASAGY